MTVTVAEACSLLVEATCTLSTARRDCAEAEADRDAYRLLAQQAIHALHDVTIERDRLRAAHHRLIDETRALRAARRQEAA